MTTEANDTGRARFATIWRAPDSPKHRRQSYWLLGSAERGFYICATAGSRDWRTALCVFESEDAAEDHLRSLGDARLFLDTLERYWASMPDWMRRDPLLPEVREASARELRRVLDSLGVEYVTVNPPPVGERTETLDLLLASNFVA